MRIGPIASEFAYQSGCGKWSIGGLATQQKDLLFYQCILILFDLLKVYFVFD
jgi:hypothetical protein